LRRAFRTWMTPLVSIDEESYAIDGKRIRQHISLDSTKAALQVLANQVKRIFRLLQ
jgi:hypothetical protein